MYFFFLALPPPGGAVHEIIVRGRKTKYYVPDIYYNKIINTYIPKEKLQLDWVYVLHIFF